MIGSEGYIEIRKNIDLAERDGDNHLFIANEAGVRYENCSHVELSYGRQLIDDVINRTETAMSQAHCFLATQLALEGQALADANEKRRASSSASG